ncbi:MAG: F0F1 ATP synthase subunit delta [Thermodesulfobacteriota bacterium]|nr:F0F1 ATP synthase subunit delta [Thermodesulfobacteriota bacterium]
MKNAILAKRYAKALFAVGKEEDAFDEYTEALNGFAEMYATIPEVLDGLTNFIYPQDVREKVMAELVKSAGLTGVMANFMNLLAQKRRADVLPDIAETFQAMVDEEHNVCQGMVVTATEIDADLKEKVKETLEKITGKQVTLNTAVDESIIGGMVAKVGDLVFDGSIKTQLAGLKESIKGSE